MARFDTPIPTQLRPVPLDLGPFQIRQSGHLYSLNDLHVASGGMKRHQPSNFLQLDQTKALLTEILGLAHSWDPRNATEIQSSDSRIALEIQRGGMNPGTYACRELVIAYAAWINAAFHLKVIRVFLAAADASRAQAALPIEPPPWLIKAAAPRPISQSEYNTLSEIVEQIARCYRMEGVGRHAAWRVAREAARIERGSIRSMTQDRFSAVETRLGEMLESARRLEQAADLVERTHAAEFKGIPDRPVEPTVWTPERVQAWLAHDRSN